MKNNDRLDANADLLLSLQREKEREQLAENLAFLVVQASRRAEPHITRLGRDKTGHSHSRKSQEANQDAG